MSLLDERDRLADEERELEQEVSGWEKDVSDYQEFLEDAKNRLAAVRRGKESVRQRIINRSALDPVEVRRVLDTGTQCDS